MDTIKQLNETILRCTRCRASSAGVKRRRRIRPVDIWEKSIGLSHCLALVTRKPEC